jgi:hypothetical protein
LGIAHSDGVSEDATENSSLVRLSKTAAATKRKVHKREMGQDKKSPK